MDQYPLLVLRQTEYVACPIAELLSQKYLQFGGTTRDL